MTRGPDGCKESGRIAAALAVIGMLE